MVSIVSDVNLLTTARPRIKNSQMTTASKNPASLDADSIDMSILPPTKIDTILNNGHSRMLPMLSLARRSLKSDFFEIFLAINDQRKFPKCLVKKFRGIKLAAD